MAEILPGIHLIDGVNPSPDFTTNVLLLKDAKGGTWTLLDTGLPAGKSPVNVVELVERYAKAHGIELNSVRHILITHLHADHTGNLKALAARTGAKTYAHWLEADFIAGKPPYKGPGMPPPDRFDVHERLKDGDTLDVFEGMVAYHTPGHTPGHVSYYCPSRKLLFPGDSIFGAGPSTVIPSAADYTFSMQCALSSLRRQAGLAVDGIVMYHGAPILKGAGPALKAAAQEGYGKEELRN